jgi:hypothetical protein
MVISVHDAAIEEREAFLEVEGGVYVVEGHP